jgi:hypothetical protein
VRHTLTVAGAAAVLIAAALAGCAHSGVRSSACPSFAEYTNASAAAADAELVAHGTIEQSTNDHLTVQLLDVVKGGEGDGASIRVGPPSQCDALVKPATDDVQLLLVKRNGAWAPITPDIGVTRYNANVFDELR